VVDRIAGGDHGGGRLRAAPSVSFSDTGAPVRSLTA